MGELKAVCLLSEGRHPASGRSRYADRDARAIALAGLLGDGTVTGLYAGANGTGGFLKDYLGMGLATIDWVRCPPDADILPALTDFLKGLRPDLVICGARAETDQGSGLLPFAIAHGLGMAVLPGIRHWQAQDDNTITLIQSHGRGRQRLLRARPPLCLTVGTDGPAPRQFAFGRARRGRINRHDAGDLPVATPPSAPATAYRPPPKRLFATPIQGNAAARLAAALDRPSAGGQTLIDPPPAEAAEAILAFLEALKLLHPPSTEQQEARFEHSKT